MSVNNQPLELDISGRPTFKLTLSDTGQISFPASIRRRLRLDPGVQFVFHVDEDGDFFVTVLRPRPT